MKVCRLSHYSPLNCEQLRDQIQIYKSTKSPLHLYQQN